MDSALDIRVLTSPSSIAIQISQMDERLRVGNLSHSFKSSNGYCVKSWQFPEITHSAIYIRGSHRDSDFSIASFDPFSESVAILLNKIVLSLKEYVEKTLKCNVFILQEQNMYRYIVLDGKSPIFTME